MNAVKLWWIALLAALGLLWGGCNGPKAADIEQQKQVIQTWLEVAQATGAQCTVQATFDGNPEFYLSSGAGMQTGLTAQAAFSANAGRAGLPATAGTPASP